MAGVPFNDRKLGARVRSKLLKEVEAILDGDDKNLKKEILMKMCTSILPRITEGSGNNGEFILRFDKQLEDVIT